MPNETDIRERHTDSGAAALVNGAPHVTPEDWRRAAANARSWGVQDTYQRCAEIAQARAEMRGL